MSYTYERFYTLPKSVQTHLMWCERWPPLCIAYMFIMIYCDDNWNDKEQNNKDEEQLYF